MEECLCLTLIFFIYIQRLLRYFICLLQTIWEYIFVLFSCKQQLLRVLSYTSVLLYIWKIVYCIQIMGIFPKSSHIIASRSDLRFQEIRSRVLQFSCAVSVRTISVYVSISVRVTVCVYLFLSVCVIRYFLDAYTAGIGNGVIAGRDVA